MIRGYPHFDRKPLFRLFPMCPHDFLFALSWTFMGTSKDSKVVYEHWNAIPNKCNPKYIICQRNSLHTNYGYTSCTVCSIAFFNFTVSMIGGFSLPAVLPGTQPKRWQVPCGLSVMLNLKQLTHAPCWYHCWHWAQSAAGQDLPSLKLQGATGCEALRSWLIDVCPKLQQKADHINTVDRRDVYRGADPPSSSEGWFLLAPASTRSLTTLRLPILVATCNGFSLVWDSFVTSKFVNFRPCFNQ